jgi:ParB family chromosome partitioning protein
VAEAVGKSRSAVANRLRLLNLPQAVIDALEEGVISAGHARTLLPLEEGEAEAVLNEILERDLSVRATEKLVDEMKNSTEPGSESDYESPPTDERPKRFDRLEAQLENSLGTAVEIDSKDKKSGTIIIHFSSPEEFESLQKRLSE